MQEVRNQKLKTRSVHSFGTGRKGSYLLPLTSYLSRHRRGFTLIEVMVVVVVIALAAGLGGGVYVGSYKRMMVEKAARDIWLMAKYARIAAIEQQQSLYLEMDKVNRRCWVATTQFDPNNVTAGPLGEMGVVQNLYCKPLDLPSGVEFEAVSVGLAASSENMDTDEYPRVLFRPNGTAESAVIAIGDGKTRYGVTISGGTGAARLVLQADDIVADLSIDLEAP
jgi:prepilin-type N-terminal cleavage/methylation domain-containing protein